MGASRALVARSGLLRLFIYAVSHGCDMCRDGIDNEGRKIEDAWPCMREGVLETWTIRTEARPEKNAVDHCEGRRGVSKASMGWSRELFLLLL
jgi:hypothetical protein